MEHFTTGLNRLKEMGKLFTHEELSKYVDDDFIHNTVIASAE